MNYQWRTLYDDGVEPSSDKFTIRLWRLYQGRNPDVWFDMRLVKVDASYRVDVVTHDNMVVLSETATGWQKLVLRMKKKALEECVK